MQTKCSYQTPRRLCDVITPLAEKKMEKLTKRPWDRFRPDLTPWFLVPSGKVTHFKHGKLYFNWADKTHDSLLAGLFIEKGLDEKLGAVYSSRKAKNFIMSSDWNWFRFITAVKDKTFFDYLNKELSNHLTINFIIDGGYVSEPTSFDPYQGKNIAWDQYTFTWMPGSNNIMFSSSKRKDFVLKLHHIKTVDDLIHELTKISEDDWLWLNIHIAIKLDITSSTDENNLWDSNDLWNNFLSSLSNWIK